MSDKMRELNENELKKAVGGSDQGDRLGDGGDRSHLDASGSSDASDMAGSDRLDGAGSDSVGGSDRSDRRGDEARD